MLINPDPINEELLSMLLIILPKARKSNVLENDETIIRTDNIFDCTEFVLFDS